MVMVFDTQKNGFNILCEKQKILSTNLELNCLVFRNMQKKNINN